MTDWLNAIASDALAMTLWESLAVLLALAYLLLAMQRSIWCWPAAFFSTLIYTVLFWQVALQMESLLNFYYMAMAVYGLWLWRSGGEQGEALPITSWSAKQHLGLIGGTALLALAVGYGMANYTQTSFPYLDAATTCFAVLTTFMVAKKVLENWLYWIVIDLVSIYLYLQKGLMLTAALFVLYVVLAVFGYLQWRKALEQPDVSFA